MTGTAFYRVGDPCGYDTAQGEEALRTAYVAITRSITYCYWYLVFDRDQVSYDWQHYITIERKPGALRNGAPFADLPKPLRLLKRGLRRHVNGDRVMTQVLAAVPITGLDSVLVAVELVLESGSLSADHILNVLARLMSTAPPPSVETSLQLKVAPAANTARYDQLRAKDEESRNA